MIPYDELQRALARWKARHSGAMEAEDQDVAVVQMDGDGPEEQGQQGDGQVDAVVDVEGDRTPGPPIAAAVAGYDNPDRTGELDLTDAELDPDSEGETDAGSNDAVPRFK